MGIFLFPGISSLSSPVMPPLPSHKFGASRLLSIMPSGLPRGQTEGKEALNTPMSQGESLTIESRAFPQDWVGAALPSPHTCPTSFWGERGTQDQETRRGGREDTRIGILVNTVFIESYSPPKTFSSPEWGGGGCRKHLLKPGIWSLRRIICRVWGTHSKDIGAAPHPSRWWDAES